MRMVAATKSQTMPPMLCVGCLAIAIAFLVLPAGNSFAQQGGGNTGGGNTGGGNTGGGNTGGGGARSATLDGSPIAGADEVFSEGVQRAGAPEARGIGTGGAEVAAGAGGNAGGLFGGGGFGGLGGLGGLSQLFGGLGQGQQQNRTIRTRLASGVEVQPVAPRMVAAAVNTRFDKLASRSRFDGVQVQVSGRKAVLNGTVNSDADRRMAVLLVRLEPGVSEVEDQLRVANN